MTRGETLQCLALGLLTHREGETVGRFSPTDLARARGEAEEALAALVGTGWHAWWWDVAAGMVSSAAWTVALVGIGMVALERHGGSVAGLMNAMGHMAAVTAK